VESVDQRGIQRLGGECARYPSSYVVCNLLRRYGLRRVLDVTYGEGRFYRLCRSYLQLLVAADPVRWRWVTRPDVFYQYNVFYLYTQLRTGGLDLPRDLDAVVVDPPRWTEWATYRRRPMFNFVVGSPRLIVEYGARVASLLGVRHLLVHYRELPKLDGFRPIHVVEFTWVARYLNTENKNRSLYALYSRV
jgi:hypothetical protein